MRSKRLLTLVVALCMLVSMMAPAANAVQINTSKPQTNENATITTNKFNDLLVSVGNALGIPNFRDKFQGATNGEGDWSVTPSDKEISVDMNNAKLPEHIQKLREAAQYYSAMDRVSAFVVLESAPLAEKYSSISAVPATETNLLTNQQNAMIDKIEADVLSGKTLDVITRFTYLTNSVVVDTEFGNLEAIASMTGVKSVFLAPVYYPCKTETGSNPYATSSGVMSNVPDVWAEGLGYTGKGMTIAVLDTGLDLDHPSFAADPALGESSWDLEFLESVVANTNAAILYGMANNGAVLTAEDLFYSNKVPFHFNYATGTTNVLHNDNLGDHGTHVAGIAAANPVEGSGVVGMAPDAQVIVMKVFNPQGGAYMYDILNALEDAMLLGCDVVNMSLGSAGGFSETGIEEIDAIYQRISETDIIVDIAAGNEGTSSYGDMHGNYMNPTDHIDNATVSSPATYVNAMAVGSVDNTIIYSPYFSLADNSSIFYMQSVEYLYGYIPYSLEILAGGELEYVMIDGLGAAEYFYDAEGNSIVEGKIAVIPRGELSFFEKAMNAQNAGALGVMIWDNVSENIFTFGMTTADGEMMPDVPVILISLEDGQKMADAEQKTLTVSATLGPRPATNGGQMSSFSSWGASPDLHLVPDITGVGGDVYSCYDGGNYGIMSGTSMATPQVAGVTALVLQYLRQAFPNATEREIRTLADALVMSTAVPVIDSNSGVEASPRQQGAGLINALNAVTAEAYLSVAGSDRPKAELFDSVDGTYTFTFSVHNYGTEAKTYTISSSLLCEDYYVDPNFPDMFFMAGTEHALDNSAVTFSAESVTVAPGTSETITVSITLTAADKEWIDTYFANGNYVEGFVYLTGEGEVQLSLPFMGFYGSWTDAPIFDEGYWYDNGFWDVPTEEPDTNEYYHVLWTDLQGTDWVLGFNPYTGALLDGEGNILYNPANNVLSPNGDGLLDGFVELYLSLMRNAKYVYLTYTDEAGNVLDVQVLDYLTKTMFLSNYGQTVPYVYSWYYYLEEMYDFTDAEGNPLPSGTQLTLTISGAVDYADCENRVDDFMVEIPVLIDTEAPVVLGEPKEIATEDGNFLVFTVDDDSLAYAAIMNPTGTKYYYEAAEGYHFDQNEDGTYTVIMDITDCGNDFLLMLADYGTNESYYDVTFTAAENKPEMDPDALYAYRVYDAYIQYYYSYDDMFAWTTLDKETGEATDLSSDKYEYYALTAAEYAGGYVFAVDAGYNFVVMEPGLWNRKQICNLGTNVVDMAFDETTGTMYVATKDDGDYGEYCTLSTIDLLTGELTVLKEYNGQYDMPWAMTFVGDKLYAIKYYYSGMYEIHLGEPYEVEKESYGGPYMQTIDTYDMVPVKGADGVDLLLKNAKGENVSPRYAQSMTYSEKDGKIYWSYYSLNDWGTENAELIAIDPTDWSQSNVAYSWGQEYVGLLTLEGTYELPTSEAVTKLAMSQDNLILSVGAYDQLVATTLPWNAPAGEVTWTSADESVAYVMPDGYVVGMSAGTTVITATCGDVSAECVVMVVDIKGDFYGFNYYTGDDTYDNWFNVNMGDMSMVNLGDCPVSFQAADYNGHDGFIYGYDEVGQFYKYNPATGEVARLGTPSGAVVADMAYDYSTGFMYALTYDYMSGTTIYYVNLNTGALVEYVTVYDIYMTLACDMYGTLYAISADGTLYMLTIYEDNGMGGGGWMPWSTEETEVTYIAEPMPILTGLGELAYLQSMCYDHNNDVILWTNPETSQVYWIDLFSADMPYVITLGDPSGTGLIEYTGMFVVPENIPELPYTPVAKLEADDMVMLEGSAKLPAVSIYPLNATNQDVTITSDNEAVVSVIDGVLVANALGAANITATLIDGETTYTVTFKVAVKASTDNIYGYLATDMATYDGFYWIGLNDSDPENYVPISYVEYNGSVMMVYAAEFVNGYIYAFGYDANDYSANFHFMKINASTMQVEEANDMGAGFPFVYDMAFDYTTGTMFAVAGPSDNNSDLYMVDMTNGKLIDCMTTAPLFLGLTIDAEGNIYAMANSEEDYDPLSWTSTYSNAILYKLDPVNGTCEPILDTGVMCNALASMAYDHDTGYIYWTGLFQGGESGLYLIDLEDGSCSNLGVIGAAGAQVTGLMVLADNYPAVPDELLNVGITAKMIQLSIGSSAALNTYVQPGGLAANMTWSSADESIATVDENGNVTGVSGGVTSITVTAEYNGTIKTATCQVVVFGAEDYFLTYNTTDGGFASISRPDSTIVNNLTENETEAPVSAMVMINGFIYAYDTEGNLFMTNEDKGFVRKYIGNCGWTTEFENTETETYALQIRDMAYDEANDRLLVLGCDVVNCVEDWGGGYFYEYQLEMTGGCKIYEADMTTGVLTEICVVANSADVESGVTMLAIDDEGQAYVYSAFMDYISKIDLETGMITQMSTFQNIGLYGSPDGDLMSMTYDPITDSLYLLFTTNGDCYRLFTFNTESGIISEIGYVGAVAYSNGDCFAGLVLNEEHEHIYETEIEYPTCTEDGKTTCTCVQCGDFHGSVIPAIGHNYESVTVDATCTEDGSITHTCTNCGDTYVDVIPAIGHSYESVTVDATCTEDGSITHTCTTCGHSYVDVIPAIGHNYESVTVDATCTEDGSITHTCTTCGHSYVDVIPAIGHSYESVTVDATCTKDGSITHTCTTCGHSYEDKIPATGHEYNENHDCIHCGAPAPDPENPELGDSGLVSVIVAALVSMMAIVALPIAKKKLF